MRAWKSVQKIVLIVTAGTTLFMSGGCKSSGGWARVPGLGWLSRDEPAPTMYAESGSAGQLPPPSAVSDPYSPPRNMPNYGGSVAGYDNRSAANSYPNGSNPGGSYSANGFVRNGASPAGSRSYPTGPYKTGPLAGSTSGEAAEGQRYLGGAPQGSYAPSYDAGSSTRSTAAGLWSDQTSYAADRGARPSREPAVMPARLTGAAVQRQPTSRPAAWPTAPRPMAHGRNPSRPIAARRIPAPRPRTTTDKPAAANRPVHTPPPGDNLTPVALRTATVRGTPAVRRPRPTPMAATARVADQRSDSRLRIAAARRGGLAASGANARALAPRQHGGLHWPG